MGWILRIAEQPDQLTGCLGSVLIQQTLAITRTWHVLRSLSWHTRPSLKNYMYGNGKCTVVTVMHTFRRGHAHSSKDSKAGQYMNKDLTLPFHSGLDFK